MSCSCLKKQKKPGSDPFERPDISHAIEEWKEQMCSIFFLIISLCIQIFNSVTAVSSVDILFVLKQKSFFLCCFSFYYSQFTFFLFSHFSFSFSHFFFLSSHFFFLSSQYFFHSSHFVFVPANCFFISLNYFCLLNIYFIAYYKVIFLLQSSFFCLRVSFNVLKFLFFHSIHSFYEVVTVSISVHIKNKPCCE